MSQLSAQTAALLEESGALAPDPEIRIPPYPAATVKLLRDRGHDVSVRQQRSGSLRYRIDGGRELMAIEMGRFYDRKYDR